MKKNRAFLLPIAMIMLSVIYGFGGCDGGASGGTAPSIEAFAANPPLPTFSSVVPTDVANGYNSSPQELALFAWQEFIALTWPAQPNPSPGQGMSNFFRGQASSGAYASTGAGGTVVWETFFHRTELFPGYPPSVKNAVLPDINAAPSYLYRVQPTVPSGVDVTVFNNLDETTEIDLNTMYFSPFADEVSALRQKYGPNPTAAQIAEIQRASDKSGIRFEAKGNTVMFSFLKSTGFNNKSVRSPAAANLVAKIMNDTLPNPGVAAYELPFGTIENKATWRRYDASKDNLKEFHWAKALYYVQNANGSYSAANDTFLLIGLHIIQKSPNVPTFTFATFEHVSNEKNGFRFVNTNPQTDLDYVNAPNGGRPLPDAGIIKAIRQYPIPGSESAFNLVAYNQAVQNLMRQQFGNDVVWANYQLIGVQAKVQDDPGGSVPPQQFFLANLATETNNTLQFFQGGLNTETGQGNVPVPDLKKVAVQDPVTKKYTSFSAGGCSGCHGSQGQHVGGDFSVISANGNTFAFATIELYPTGTVVDQNPALFPLPHGKPPGSK